MALLSAPSYSMALTSRPLLSDLVVPHHLPPPSPRQSPCVRCSSTSVSSALLARPHRLWPWTPELPPPCRMPPPVLRARTSPLPRARQPGRRSSTWVARPPRSHLRGRMAMCHGRHVTPPWFIRHFASYRVHGTLADHVERSTRVELTQVMQMVSYSTRRCRWTNLRMDDLIECQDIDARQLDVSNNTNLVFYSRLWVCLVVAYV